MTDAYAQDRTLVLLRHSKAEPPGDRPDVDRPLAPRGRADAAAAGAWLAHNALLPDLVICSSARRTRETWHGVAMGMTGAPPEGGSAGPAPDVQYADDAYEAHPEDLLALVRRVNPVTRTVLLIAHNPGVSQLSALLNPEQADRDALRTSEVVVHRTTAEWAGLGRGTPSSPPRTPRAVEPAARGGEALTACPETAGSGCRRCARQAQDGGAVGGGGSGGGGIIAVGCDSRFSSTIRVRARLRRSCQNHNVVSRTASRPG